MTTYLYNRLQDKPALAFTSLLLRKGYDEYFELRCNQPAFLANGYIEFCLEKFRAFLFHNGSPEVAFTLATYAYYQHSTEYCKCLMQVEINATDSFRILQLSLHSPALKNRAWAKILTANDQLPARRCFQQSNLLPLNWIHRLFSGFGRGEHNQYFPLSKK